MNRIAGWGAALADTFGRPGILGEERYTPAMVKAGESEDAPEATPAEENQLYIEDVPPLVVEQVRDDVTDAVTRVMINPDGIKQPGILAKLAEAACWPFGAAAIVNAVQTTLEHLPVLKDGTKEPLSTVSYGQLVFCLNMTLPTIASVHDHATARRVLGALPPRL